MRPLWRLATRNFHRVALLLLILSSTGCAGSTNAQRHTPTATSPGPYGADWAMLESVPLHLPRLTPGTACPVTPGQSNISPSYPLVAGAGPVYLASQEQIGIVHLRDPGSLDAGSPWKISKQFWQVSSRYRGPAIIRGHQIDGDQSLQFNGGLGQTTENAQGTEPLLPELRLAGDGQTWQTVLSFVRAQTAGCYGAQVDGNGFSEVIIFTALTSPA